MVFARLDAQEDANGVEHKGVEGDHFLKLRRQSIQKLRVAALIDRVAENLFGACDHQRSNIAA
jgi:hypothetical protein